MNPRPQLPYLQNGATNSVHKDQIHERSVAESPAGTGPSDCLNTVTAVGLLCAGRQAGPMFLHGEQSPLT